MEHQGTVYFFTGLSGAGRAILGGLFCRRLKERKPNVIGVELPFEEPQSPDIIIQNDGLHTPLELAEEIKRTFGMSEVARS